MQLIADIAKMIGMERWLLRLIIFLSKPQTRQAERNFFYKPNRINLSACPGIIKDIVKGGLKGGEKIKIADKELIFVMAHKNLYLDFSKMLFYDPESKVYLRLNNKLNLNDYVKLS